MNNCTRIQSSTFCVVNYLAIHSWWGYNLGMFSIYGIGTTLYGKNEVDPADGSYIATKWFTFFLLPIVPLRSYRVQRGETTVGGFFPIVGAKTQYKMTSVSISWKQVAQIYGGVYGILALIFLDAIFDPNIYIGKSVLVIGIIYLPFHLFRTGSKWWALLTVISYLVVLFAFAMPFLF